MTAIGMTCLLSGFLAGLICIGLEDEGYKIADWVAISAIAVFITGLLLTVTGILVWAWRVLP